MPSQLVQGLQALRYAGPRAAPVPQPSQRRLLRQYNLPRTSRRNAASACGCRSSLRAMMRWELPRCTCWSQQDGTSRRRLTLLMRAHACTVQPLVLPAMARVPTAQLLPVAAAVAKEKAIGLACSST